MTARTAARVLLRVLACAGLLLGAAALHAADGDAKKDAATGSRFFDAPDGWFDVSGFLDTAYGFVPIVTGSTIFVDGGVNIMA